MTYQQIIQSIRALKIQGSENITLAGVKAFKLKLGETKNYAVLKKYYREIKTARLTEPALRNAVKFCLEHYKNDPKITEKVPLYFKKSRLTIARIEANKIKTGMTIATHCYSSTVIAIILKAHQQGKKIKVYTTETRPNFTGRLTAKTLARHGIEVHHVIDSAGRIALKASDIFLFGCDALTKDGRIINKIGTAIMLEFAYKYKVPSYCCTNSWKFDPETDYGTAEEIEPRHPSEIWKNPPKNVLIHNPGFEPVSAALITGFITELGIMKAKAFIQKAQTTYPWIL